MLQQSTDDSDFFGGVDWEALFVPNEPLAELILRGSIVYLALFLFLRIVLKRESGTLGVTDLLVVVLIADAAQNGLAGGYESIPEGLILVAVILGWSLAVNWVGYHVPAIGRLVHPQPLELVRDGEMIRENMRRELITREELLTQLREQGVERVEQVKTARIEGNGMISVITMDGQADSRGVRKRAT